MNPQNNTPESAQTARLPPRLESSVQVGEEGLGAHGKKEKKAHRSGKSAALNICSPFWPS